MADKRILVTRSSMPTFEEYCEEIRPLWESHWLTNMGVEHKKLEAALKEKLGVENLALFTKTENNRFENNGSVSWDGSKVSAGGGTKKGRMKARRIVAKRCVPYFFVSSNYTAGFGGFKYQAAGLPAVA